MMNTFALWIRASRLFAVTASIIPVLLAFVLAFVHEGVVFPWILFFLTLFAAVFSQTAANMLSDYFDFKKGVDRPGTLGSSGVLIEKLISPSTLLRWGLVTFFLALFFGIAALILAQKVLLLLPVVLFGVILIISYTAPFFPYKYFGLGELGVFLGFGPVLVCASYIVAGGESLITPFFYSLPITYLVVGILLGNNIRDIENDRVAGIKTFAMTIGRPAAKGVLIALVLLPYATTLLCVLFGIYSPIQLAVLILLALAVFQVKNILSPNCDWKNMDAEVAKHHLLFGLIFCASIFGGHYLG